MSETVGIIGSFEKWEKDKICIGCFEFGTALVLRQGVPYADTHMRTQDDG